MAKDNIHDKFFKENFSRRDITAAFIEEAFADLYALLDLNTLELTNGSYTDRELDESFADLVYVCRLSGEPIKVALLFEHKSAPERFPHVQLLGYLLNSLREDIKQGRPPTPVIPILFYHGKARWQYKPLTACYGTLPPGLAAFIPEFRYLLFDLSQLPDEQLAQFRNRFLATALLLMKHRQDVAYLEAQSDKLFYWLGDQLDTREGTDFLRTAFVYIAKVNKFEGRTNAERIFAKTTMAEKFISIYDGAVLEGRAVGLAEGRQEGRQEGRREGQEVTMRATVQQMYRFITDSARIVELTGFPEEKVKAIIETLSGASA